MKKIFLTISLLVGSLLLSSCCLNHEFKEATCEEPMTCTICGFKWGFPAGHKFDESSTESNKVCTVCGKTECEAYGHEWGEWEAASGSYNWVRVCLRDSSHFEVSSETEKPSK